MAKYTFDKYMMAGERLDIAKAINGRELKEPYALVMGDDFFTENGLYDKSGLISEWTIAIHTVGSRSAAPVPTDFETHYEVAYNGEGLKTGELITGDFDDVEEARDMGGYYSYFSADTTLKFKDGEDNEPDLYYINSKGDYVTDGELFTFMENAESFSITWQDDIPGDKGELVSGFVVRTTPYTDPDPRR